MPNNAAIREKKKKKRLNKITLAESVEKNCSRRLQKNKKLTCTGHRALTESLGWISIEKRERRAVVETTVRSWSRR